jgi:SecD/SecF fusion protein
MKNSKTRFVRHWWFLMTVVLGTAIVFPARALSQDAKSASPPAEANADASATATKTEPAAKDAEKSKPPATDESQKKSSVPTNEPPAKSSAPGKTGDSTAPTATAPAVKAAPTDGKASLPPVNVEAPPSKETSMPAGKTLPSVAKKALDKTNLQEQVKPGWSPWILALVLLALFVLPIMAGNYLARIWRMPDHAWKLSLVIGTLAASILICVFGQFKFGPDLAGGITLIYELAEAPTAADANQPAQPSGSRAAETRIKSGSREFRLSDLTSALKKRVDPDGTKEIAVREYGKSAVEIIIPEVGEDEREFVKQKLTKIGALEFRITADPAVAKDQNAIKLARATPPSKKDVMQGDTKIAEWVPYDVNAKEFGPPEREDHYVKRMANGTPEALVLIDPYNVTGAYLTKAIKSIDEKTGGPAVHFSFDAVGAQRFERLTGDNLPNPATGNVYRNLGVILDKILHTAPQIESKISNEGRISGGSMTDQQVEAEVEVLNAGSLPAALNKTPISEDIISPTLGGVTVDQGKQAITASLICVVLFMLVYYRFSGVVASIGLALNLVMVLAVMVLIKAAFTLPGLAGLALTVGMSVDTNVLIYERIREELNSGAALRMAIRNGFGRAMRAIIDTHLTTIISGIVLFYVGTDQVKGFAVTLILGLLVNLFTAFFCTRVMFDVAERRGYIKELKMMHIFTHPNIDFLGIRWVALGASWVLIIIGMVAVYFRGSQLLDIDFTGGSSVSFSLNEKISIGDVRKQLETAKIGDKTLKDMNLLVVERGNKSTEYTIDTSEQSVDAVKQVISSVFGNKLKKYSFEYRDLKPVKEADFTGVEAKLLITSGAGNDKESGVTHDALSDQIVTALAKNGHSGIQPILENPNYHPGSSARFNEWTVRIAEVDVPTARAVLDPLQKAMRDTPLFPLASKIGGRVSSDMQYKALEAIGISLVAMVIYLWLRFAKPAYGIAAGVALIHDVLVTIGLLALSEYIVIAVPGIAHALKIDSFQINLTIVAALLTIIGYSVNDTIVTFDRLREIKGKSPNITAKMVNDSVNQTLSRTILTVFTVFIVVVILYFFGGEGLHPFAFAFMVGIVTGTYSSVYIASPVVLWLSGVSAAPAREEFPGMGGMQPAR